MTIELLSCIFSLAAVIAAVLSPVIVVLINNRHQAKKDERDFYEKHRCEVIEQYLQHTARFLYGHSTELGADYGASIAEIYMYIPSFLWSDIDQMNDAVLAWSRADDYNTRSYYLDQAKQQYRDLCKAFAGFSRSPKSTKKQRRSKGK